MCSLERPYDSDPIPAIVSIISTPVNRNHQFRPGSESFGVVQSRPKVSEVVGSRLELSGVVQGHPKSSGVV